VCTVAIWTIAAQEGAGGERVAAELAAAAGVPLLDRETLAVFAHELEAECTVDDFREIEHRVGGRLSRLALSLAMSGPAAAAACQELEFRDRLPELGRAVMGEAARGPCVILAPAAFAAFPAHPGAIHVRLRAPLECRISAYQREHLVDRACAEKEIKHDDHLRSAWVRSLYHVEIDDPRHFTIVLDASRYSPERLVEILLAAGGRAPVTAARELEPTPAG
jgi:cytidylate kinase-like protein